MHQALAPGPVGLAQFALEDLARAALRQCLDEGDRLVGLERIIAESGEGAEGDESGEPAE